MSCVFFLVTQKSSFFFPRRTHTKGSCTLLRASSQTPPTTKGLIKSRILFIQNRQKHRAPPLKEDEDGTQTLLETVRVLHRALQSEFIRFCTGALRRLRAARVLDRHRRIEIRELARVVRGGLSFSFFFSSCAFRRLSLPFFCCVRFYG